MKITSFDQFKELARRGTFVPVCKEIVADLLTPVSAFLKIAEHVSPDGAEKLAPSLNVRLMLRQPTSQVGDISWPFPASRAGT